PNGTPLTQLDSIFVPSGTFTVGQYNEINTSSPIPITSGGIYVAWMMGGDGVLLGEDGLPPFSFQSYEVLGVASNPNTWAEYRNNELSDPIINAVISTSTGIHEVSVTDKNSFGEFYPNPVLSKTKISFNLDESSDLTVSIYDIQGQLLYNHSLGKTAAGAGSFEVDMKGYDAGIYTCRINAGNNEYLRKITLMK
ncbi:MAG: T9SS type A sorting domain-containing protein, partial [Bacteroidota bacterium]